MCTPSPPECLSISLTLLRLVLKSLLGTLDLPLHLSQPQLGLLQPLNTLQSLEMCGWEGGGGMGRLGGGEVGGGGFR